MLIAEELLLIAIDPVKGTLAFVRRRPVSIAVAGAVLAELAIDGRVDLSGRRILAPPTQDATLLGRAQQLVVASGSRGSAAGQLLGVEAGKTLWAALVDGLVQQGVLQRRLDKVWWWEVTRHPAVDPRPRAAAVELASAALLGTRPLDRHTAALVALAAECGLLKHLIPDGIGRAALKRRVREAADATPAARIVDQAIQRARKDG